MVAGRRPVHPGSSVCLGKCGSFSAPETVPTANGRGDYGDTAVGPHGQVMVTYQDRANGQGGAHLHHGRRQRPDGGRVRRPAVAGRTSVGGFDYIPAQPHRLVDARANLAWDRSGGPHTGRVYAVWTQEAPNQSDNTDIMFQYSDNNGAAWTPPEPVGGPRVGR